VERTATERAAVPARVRVTGIVPPITTPFLGGRVDLEALRRQLDYLVDSVEGVLVGGSTGEAASLTLAERESVIRTVAGHLSGTGRTLVVSIADNSIENSRRLSEIAGEVGAELLALSCPNYFVNRQSMLAEYFAAVGDFVSADICLYDNPIASHTFLSVAEILSLLASVPRITHIKMTDVAIGKVAAVLSQADVTVLAGEDSVLWHQLNSGADGTMSAISMIYPERTARMWHLFRSGALEDAYAEYQQLAPFITVGLHGDDYVASVKVVLRKQGVLESDEVRLPLVALQSERRAEVLAAL
jgi:4-hydroxy-tetrahydrodipicolinate synthase